MHRAHSDRGGAAVRKSVEHASRLVGPAIRRRALRQGKLPQDDAHAGGLRHATRYPPAEHEDLDRARIVLAPLGMDLPELPVIVDDDRGRIRRTGGPGSLLTKTDDAERVRPPRNGVHKEQALAISGNRQWINVSRRA